MGWLSLLFIVIYLYVFPHLLLPQLGALSIDDWATVLTWSALFVVDEVFEAIGRYIHREGSQVGQK
jgi:hypothetical protein